MRITVIPQKKKLKPETKRNYLVLLLYIIFLLMTTQTITILAYERTARNSQIRSAHPFLNPARGFYGQNDLIIDFQPLREKLEAVGNNHTISIYFEFFNSGANIAVNKDANFYPASLLKLPIAMAVIKKIERGKWQWSNELVLLPSDKDETFGQLYKNPIGSRFTIETLIKETLVNSDNTAANILVRNLEPEEFRAVYRHLGLLNFFTPEGKISAKKYSALLRSLYNATFLSAEHSEVILKHLVATPFNDFLAAGVPETVSFGHKIGINREKNVYLDSGIVYADRRPYLLTVMIQTSDETEAKRMMESISENVYNYVRSYQQPE